MDCAVSKLQLLHLTAGKTTAATFDSSRFQAKRDENAGIANQAKNGPSRRVQERRSLARNPPSFCSSAGAVFCPASQEERSSRSAEKNCFRMIRLKRKSAICCALAI